MSSVNDPRVDHIQQAMRDAVRHHAGLFLTQGILITLLGVAAVIWPQVSTLAVDIYVGWLLLLSGIIGLALMFMAPSGAALLWSLLTGALALFAGVLLLWHPVQGAVSLTLVLVAFFIAEGVFQIGAAFGYRAAFPQSWSGMLISGVIDLILAWLIIAGWPGSASWALGLIVGVNLITSGIAIVMVASAAKKLTRAGR